MHPEVVAFLRSATEVDWSDALVYEVGSLNVNGQARDCVPAGWRKWVGFDLIDGPGVDVPGDACETLPNFPPADVIVTTEVLEHYEQWERLIGVMCDQLRPGGWLVLTCAGKGRLPHSADGSTDPHGWEHYRNVELDEVAQVAARHGVTQVFGEEGWPGDTRFIGRKDVMSDG